MAVVSPVAVIAPLAIASPQPDAQTREGTNQTPGVPGKLDFHRLTASVIAGLIGGALLLSIVFVFDTAGAKDWLRSRTTPIRSIAVLPLENTSGNAEMDYLCQGISEETTNSLSRLPNLQVIALTTATQYKARTGDTKGVGPT